MSSRKQMVIELIAKTANVPYGVAESVVERLSEEGVLHLGYGDPEVDAVLEKFSETFGTSRVSRYDRFAANRMVKLYGSRSVIGIIEVLGQHRDDRFAPVVRSIDDFEKKWVSITHFLRKLSTDNDEVIEA